MEDTSRCSHITIGILAHVDAGKTTLSESMMYLTGQIRTLGRVDHKDAFLIHMNWRETEGLRYFPNRQYSIWKKRK